MHLDESELFITLVLQNLSKESDFMVILQVGPDSMYDSTCPFND